jgi:hypothetical protein
MKWMRWSWDDYRSAPPEIVDEIVKLIQEEQKEMERIRNA